MRAEVGVFQVLLLVFGSALGGVSLWIADLGITRRKAADDGGKLRLSVWTWVRLALYTGLICIVLLRFGGDLGRPVGGLVVFDEQGNPLRATMQVLARSGGKMKVDHVVLRAFGADGSTSALHRQGYGGGRKPLHRSSTFWDGDELRSVETLSLLASGEEIRTAVPDLVGVESRLLRAQGDGAVFERRDGVEVTVRPTDVVKQDDLAVTGCLLDVQLRGRAAASELIDPELVPWAKPGAGCASVPPAGVWLLASADAAFGEVRPLLTLRDETGARWQTPLTTVIKSENPVLIGAVPFTDTLTIVGADADALVFSSLRWEDGALVSVVRWQ